MTRTRQQCIEAAGAAWAEGCAAQDALPPRAAAEAAWRPGGPSVDDLEARITARRAGRPVSTDTSPPTG